jgi:hypothetical protein
MHHQSRRAIGGVFDFGVQLRFAGSLYRLKFPLVNFLKEKFGSFQGN